MVPDDSLTIRQRAIAAWPIAWGGQNQRDILISLGYDVDRPWRELAQKDRDWILFTDEQPVVPVYAGVTPEQAQRALRRREEPSYHGTFSSARSHVPHTFANTQSPLMKKRVTQYMLSGSCPGCLHFWLPPLGRYHLCFPLAFQRKCFRPAGSLVGR